MDAMTILFLPSFAGMLWMGIVLTRERFYPRLSQ